MNRFLLLFLLFIASFTLRAQAPDFKLNRTFGTPVVFPYAIEVDLENNMYVLDEGRFINKLDPSGALVKTYPLDVDQKNGTAFALALDKSGNMYVADTTLNMVRKFSPTGELMLQFGSKGSGPGQFNFPKGLTVDAAGNIYVADYLNNRVQKFDAAGKFLFEVKPPAPPVDAPIDVKAGKSGLLYILTESYRILKIDATGKQLAYYDLNIPDLPSRIGRENNLALDDAEQIYLADVQIKKVIKLTNLGQPLQSFGTNQWETGYFGGMKIGIALSANGQVYTTDRNHAGSSAIQVFHPDGSLKKRMANIEHISAIAQDWQGNYYLAVYKSAEFRHFIKKYNAFGLFISQFPYPSNQNLSGYPDAIKVDDAGNIFVLDGTHSPPRIAKFSNDGRQLAEFTNFGPDAGWNRLTDLALDAQGNMFVTDLHGGCVRKFSSDGSLLAKIATKGTAKGQLSYPNALVVDAKGFIYVSDLNGNRIQKFSPNGQVTEVSFATPQPAETNIIRLSALAVDADGKVFHWNGTGWGNHQTYISVFNADGKEVNRLASLTGTYGRISLNRRGTKLLVAKANVVLEYLSGEVPQESLISGKIFQDANGNCIPDVGEMPLSGIVVMAEPGPYYGISDEQGQYAIPVDTGRYTVKPVLPQDPGRTITPTCPAAPPVKIERYGSFVNGPDFGHQVSIAPVLSVSVASNRRRRCFRNTTTISYANTGFAPAANAKVTVQLPEYVAFISANLPHTRDARGNYIFALGDLQPNQRGTITLLDSVSCADPGIRGLTVCTKAWITPVNTYPTPANWNRADISVAGKTLEDGQARFVIRNNGPGDMTDSLFFRIYQDAELVLNSKYLLAARDSLVLRFAPTGRALRLEADQPEGHPLKATAGVNVEVRQRVAFGLPAIPMMAFPPDDPEPEIAQDCQPIIDSFDPNDKQVVPVGLTAERYTPTNTPLRYTIRFQNTGTDLAYRVVVVDTLSSDLDLGTLQVGAVSHNYRLAVTGKARPVLTFTFDNIMLPDSARDQAGSNGFIQFSIRPKAHLPEKATIGNYADIFFDYNEPVRTNTTINRIYDMPLEVIAGKQLLARNIIASPALSSFSPVQSRAGQKVTLTGRNFAPTPAGNKVTFNGVQATVVSATDSTLMVLVPANAFSGKIQVLTPDGGAQSSSDYVIFQQPTLTAVAPAEAIPGTIVTLTGTHFSPLAAQDTVMFNGVPARVLDASEITLKVEVPTGATFGTIQVKTLGGQVESTQPFMVWYPPVISNFSPGKGKVGAAVVLNGEHFAEAAGRNEVQFGTIPAQVLEASASRLLVKVPARAPSGRIRVQTPGGTAYTPTGFTFIPAPEITDFSPARGHAGTTVVLTGRDFNADGQPDTVYFNNMPAKVLKATETLLEVQAPKGVRSGTITVAGAGGKAIATGFVVPDLMPEDAIEIYPNPTKAAITINWFKADFTVESLRVYNAIGKLVAEPVPGAAPNDELELSLARFGSGIYLFRLQTSAGPVVKRVMVL